MALKHDVQLVATYAPLVGRVLALNVSARARAILGRSPVPPGVALTDFDPFDHATAANPYPAYRKLHALGRVHYNPKRDIYLLSRYEDVRAAARADDVLSNAEGVAFARIRDLPVFLHVDRPEHTRMRKKALPAFTRGALESWKPMVDTLAGELVDTVLAEPGADVVAKLAVPMPMRMITHILGIPEQDEAKFRRWSNQTIHIADIELTPRKLLEMVPTFAGFRHMNAFFLDKLAKGELIDEATALGRLVANAEEGAITHEELFFFAVLLLLAGNETTTNLLSTLFLTLAENPGILPLLRQRPELIPSALEEQLRYISPIQSFYRTALADYQVGEAVIPKGSRVLLLWGAANRDAREYKQPEVFRADRNPTGHVAFGSGIHLCLGAHLARMEGQAILREIVDKVDRVEVVGPPAWSTNPNLRGLTAMQVRLTPRASTTVASGQTA